MCAAQVNALARNVVEELPDLLSALEADPDVKAIVFVSAKKDFIVGADINMFKELAAAGREGVREMVKSSHPVFDMMASGKPKIAAINGSCLGGGAEFALSCHYRIATTTASLGFPEVKLRPKPHRLRMFLRAWACCGVAAGRGRRAGSHALARSRIQSADGRLCNSWQVMLGLLPGFGGTQRLPALVGMQNAMPMLMTGSNKKGPQAKKMKLVDLTCDANQLMQVGGRVGGVLRVCLAPVAFDISSHT